MNCKPTTSSFVHVSINIRSQPKVQPKVQPKSQPKAQPRSQPRSQPKAQPKKVYLHIEVKKQKENIWKDIDNWTRIIQIQEMYNELYIYLFAFMCFSKNFEYNFNIPVKKLITLTDIFKIKYSGEDHPLLIFG